MRHHNGLGNLQHRVTFDSSSGCFYRQAAKMAFNQLKERMREHQAEMKRRAEQRKDAMELRRNKRLQVDLEPVLAASPSSTSAAPSIQWDEYKDSLQRFYDDRQTFLDKDDDDAHSEVPEEFRKHQSKNTDVSELPEEFFQTADSKFDVVDYVLEALPEHLDNDRLILYITSQMEKNDLFRDRVCQDLTAVVLEKYDTFVAGMQTVRDIDMDLSTADMYATNSRRLLAGFKESLITSTLRVVQRQRLRQRAVLIHEMVTVLERAQSLRSTMQTAIKDRRFADAVSAYTRAYTELQGKKSQRLSAINDIRASLPKYVAMLQDELDAELRELCFEGFDATKYAAVLRAYLLLDEHSQSQLEAQVAECVEEPKPMTVLIKCPDRMGPGDKVTVRTPNGRKFRVTIPPGTEAGKQFRVTMPLSESDRDVMSIKCPNGARPGQKLMVTTTKGQRVQAVVPEGCSPGIKFFIRIPKVCHLCCRCPCCGDSDCFRFYCLPLDSPPRVLPGCPGRSRCRCSAGRPLRRRCPAANPSCCHGGGPHEVAGASCPKPCATQGRSIQEKDGRKARAG